MPLLNLIRKFVDLIGNDFLVLFYNFLKIISKLICRLIKIFIIELIY
jgi:hypothetical protein